MAREPLVSVLKLRQRAVDQARINLAQAVAEEAAAHTEARAAEQAIEAEAERASDPEGSDDLVEAYAAWLPGARQRAAAAVAAQERLSIKVSCQRAELAATRTGLEVIETLLRQKREELAQEQARRMQRAIDEAAARGRSTAL